MKESLETRVEVLAEQCTALLQSPVAVLCGGQSAERDISLQSGAAVFAALGVAGIDAVSVDVDDHIAQRLLNEDIQHTFLALHGPGGEDGVMQGLLQKLNISYTGSGVLASALALDKLRSKLLWQALAMPTPAFLRLQADADWQSVLDHLGGSVFVKPVSEGSSLGMSIARTTDELMAAFELASQYDQQVIAEQLIDGPEFTVSIVGNTVLPSIGLTTDRDFYDFNAKYVGHETQYILPCGLATWKDQELREIAYSAYQALGCEGWGRVDVMQNATGEFFVLEINTIPGLTDHSLVPMAAAAAGVNFEALVLHILLTSLRKGEQHA